MEIVELIRVFQKFKALDMNRKFSDAMINYINFYASEKLQFKQESLKFTTELILKMCGIKEEKIQQTLSRQVKLLIKTLED